MTTAIWNMIFNHKQQVQKKTKDWDLGPDGENTEVPKKLRPKKNRMMFLTEAMFCFSQTAMGSWTNIFLSSPTL